VNREDFTFLPLPLQMVNNFCKLLHYENQQLICHKVQIVCFYHLLRVSSIKDIVCFLVMVSHMWMEYIM